MKTKRILITGASGLVGANCVEYYVRRGYIVRILLRRSSVLATDSGNVCEIAYGDLTDRESVSNAVEGCDWVIHAASQVHDTGIALKTYIDINYEGTKNIVAACIRHKVAKLIYIGTASIVNGGTKDDPATELNDFELVHLNSGYLYSKYLAHQFVAEQVLSGRLDAVILSPGFVLGPLDAKPSSGKLLLRANNKRVLVCPPGRKYYVHVADVVSAVDAAIHKSEKGEHYLICNEGLSYKEIYKKLNVLTGQRSLIITLPKILLLFLGAFGSVFSRITKIPVALTYEAAYMLCINSFYSNRKSREGLGLTYHHTEKAIVDAVDWFTENGQWKTKELPAHLSVT